MDAVGPSGGLGPTGGGSQAAPNGDSVKTPEFANYLTNLERDLGLPNGVMASLAQQESNWRNLGYHYKEGPDGRRVAPNGNVSTASGIFGILDSTATDPGYGVTPLSGPAYLHTPEEQARFAAEYLAARIDNAGGSVELGLAGYGEGARYAKQVQGRLAAAPNVAPQQGLTGQVAVGPATATPNPYAKEYEAYKAPKPLSVKEQSELAQLVNEELKMMNTDALSPADLNALKSEIARNALVRAGRLPPEAAVDPFVQASTGAQKQPGPAVPQQGFGAVLADTTKGLQTGAEDKALRTEQLRYRQELKRVHDSLGWFEANKASPMAAASAKQAVALIEGLWPTPLLTDTDRAAAKQTLSSLLLLFPELRSTQ
jgi:hypothetical protein